MSKLFLYLAATAVFFFHVFAGGPSFKETHFTLTGGIEPPSNSSAPICGTLPYKPCETFTCPESHPYKKALAPKYGCCCSNNTLLWG